MILENAVASNQAATAASATGATTAIVTKVVKATGNIFKANKVKLELPGKLRGDPSKL